MKLRHPALLRLAGFAGACVLKAWHASLDIRLDCSPDSRPPANWRRQRVIYCFWHENMLIGAKWGEHTRVLVSRHADGELITQVAQRMGITVARGSTSRGGAGGLLDLIRGDERRNLAITPDGPRGPRRRVKPGVIFLASATGLPIVPSGVGFQGVWRAKSWDRFAIAHPWSRVMVRTAPLFWVPNGVTSSTIETYRHLLERQMHFLDEDAQRWADGRPRLAKSDFPTSPIVAAPARRRSA